MLRDTMNIIKELDWNTIRGNKAQVMQLAGLLHKSMGDDAWACYISIVVADAIAMPFDEGETEMTNGIEEIDWDAVRAKVATMTTPPNSQPIEEVRAIAHYIDELLTRMDFVPEQVSKHKRKASTWYEKGHLDVAVSVTWVGELPEV